MKTNTDRRSFIKRVAALSPILILPSSLSIAEEKKEDDVGPAEDLMREHGGLNRILLIYEECTRRISVKEDFNLAVLKDSAEIIRDFIESYHEKLEEEFLFPRLKNAGKLIDLVDTLESQHRAGRKLTAKIIELSKNQTLKSDSDKTSLIESLKLFIRMYRPHESREDTILFPTFHSMLTPKEYDKLGDQFEDREHKLFGKEGFEGVVAKIGELEKKLNIFDLSKFTPKI